MQNGKFNKMSLIFTAFELSATRTMSGPNPFRSRDRAPPVNLR
jgi:hypothetical protein